ncbi:trypsin delta [Drosophila miranda]|uniref:trypsin delta n=1 Tax=Drosophila miranda TaxID=7229 RepID=UPI0007E61CD1|nr:trypsin delta [Drosophila miranda]
MLRIWVAFCLLGVGASLADPVHLNAEVQVPLPDGRIVGGQDTDVINYPHQISMRYRGNHRCGGSLYSTNIIISAAHCVSTLDSPADLTIVAGSTMISIKTQELPVRNIIIHPNYRTINNDYDAAILVTDGDFIFNELAHPIPLAQERPEHGSAVIVTGWGTTTENGYLSNVLQEVEVNVVENSQCKSAYSIMLTSRMLCAGVTGGGKDACQGDSGGPLIYNNQLLGIVSWGTGCARENYPGVYASVPELRSWLLETIESYENVGKIDFL